MIFINFEDEQASISLSNSFVNDAREILDMIYIVNKKTSVTMMIIIITESMTMRKSE